jgi:hypothetical protein
MSQYEKFLRKATAIVENQHKRKASFCELSLHRTQRGGKRYKHSDTRRSPIEQK